MKLHAAITTAVLAGSLYAPGQDGFIVHFNDQQAGRSGTGSSVREVNDGFLVFCRQYSQEFFDQQHIYTRLLNDQGEILQEREFLVGDPRSFDLGYLDPIANSPDGTFAAAVAEGFDYDGATSFYVFDETGDTLSRRVNMVWPYSDSLIHAIRQTRLEDIGYGYISCGFFDPIESSSRAFMVKYDASGDTLWTKQYAVNGQGMVALGINSYPGGGYIMIGYRSASSVYDSSFLQRMDSSGALIWRRYFGDYATQNGAFRFASDGGIVTWSNYRELTWPFEERQLMLTKWNAAGEVVWQKKSHSGYYASSRDFEVLPDGSFIGTAFSAEAGRNGLLCKFSAQGDSLWTRAYQVASGPHYLNDVTLTSDGGFVCTGEANRIMPQDAPNFQQSQTIWVLKTDSLGCVVPGCHTVGVEEYALDLNEYLRITPNPVLAGQSLHFTFDPPIEHEAQGPRRMLLLDAMGRQVREETTMHGTGHSTSTANLSPGLYYLHLADGTRWLAGGKVVLE